MWTSPIPEGENLADVGRRAQALIDKLIATNATIAQPGPPLLPDDTVRKLVELALKNMQGALCGDRKPCSPATPEEFQTPPVSIEHARTIVMTAARTAFADWCGLDWQRRSFLPMMRHYRHTLRFTERQMALVALLHGIQQGMLSEQLKAKGACEAATRAGIEAQLPRM